MGSRANRGKGWEAKLITQHAAYRKAGRATIFQAHPAAKLARGKLIRQKAPPDFFGVAQGIPVLFDAKKHEGTRWPFSALKLHQARALEAWEANGGVAGIALKLDGQTWWVSWLKLGPVWWEWKEGSGMASVGADWLRANATDLEGTADWLRGVL